MEFNENEEEQEQEEQEEVVGIQQQQQPQPQPPVHLNFEPVVKKPGGGGYRFKECLKNHAVSIGGQAVDGCGEFMPTGDEGTLEALKCAACSCHRNFHRKETDHHHQQGPLTFPLPLQQTYYHHHHNNNTHQPRGYLQLKPPPPPRTLALPSSCREDLDDISNPSSSGGGGGGGLRKRFRTKFTAEQKDRMLAISEALGWRIQKQDESVVQRFCAETGVKRHVLKVWMHNNKHMVGKKP